MRYELAIFDMDGTILNTLEDLKDSINHALNASGFPELTSEQTGACIGNGAVRMVELAVPGGTSEEAKSRVLADFISYYKDHSAEKTRPYPGITELLKTLREAGVKTAVVSNKPDAVVKQLASDCFPELFDMAVGEDEAAGIKKKPAPDEVEFVLRAMGFYKMQAVYIGDSDVDIATARNSGIDLISVDWGYRTREFLTENGSETVVSTAYEVEKLILTDLSSVKTVICPNCGARFEDNRDRCPFCNTIYEEGAERVYMHKLDEIRDDMDDLSGRTVTDTVKEVKKVSKLTIGIIIGIAAAVLALALISWAVEFFSNAYDRAESKAIEKWEEENQDEWNRMYADGEYEELYVLYTEGNKNDDPVWDFDGRCMMDAMDDVRSFQEYYEDYKDPDYKNSKNLVNLLLYNYYEVVFMEESDELTDAEKEYLAPETEAVLEEGKDVFGLSREELESLQNDNGIVSWDRIEDMTDENWDEWKD